MMNSQLPTITTNGMPLLDSPSSASPSKRCLLLDTSGGVVPRISVVLPMSATYPAPSPTGKCHPGHLPDSVHAVDATDTDAVAPFLSGSSDVLVVDVRPFNVYSTLRLRTSFNICIPTTLLKRPSYDLQHVVNASSLPADRKEMVMNDATHMKVLVYDNCSTPNQVSFQLYQTLSKFLRHDRFSVHYLNGGFQRVDLSLVQTGDVLPQRSPVLPRTPHSAQLSNTEWARSQAHLQPDDSLPFLSGFSLPSATASNQSLLMSIKKNLPKLDTNVTYNYDFKFPDGFADKKDKLPEWLSFFANVYDQKSRGKLIVEELSGKFNKIERTEQVRLKMAISNFDQDSQCESARHSPHDRGECTPLALCPCCDEINYMIPKGIEYGYKNRYNNIWPYEHSRVRLISSPSCANKKEQGDDYFNANYIHYDKLSQNKYIATQNPLDSTNEDFWNTVWYNGVKGIVCLDNPLLFAKHSYYEVNQHFEKSNLDIKVESCEKHDGFTVREIAMKKHDTTHKLYHFAYTEWPDFGTPDDLTSVIDLMKIKNEKLSELAGQQPPTVKVPQAWDLLVHCSAGCGRTGCYITLDMVLDCFDRYDKNGNEKTEGEFSPWGKDDLVYKSVQFQRQQRISMVQNLDQFIYCYESVLNYVVEKLIQ